MVFNTERLELIIPALEQLKLLRFDRKGFEQEFNCTYQGEPLEGFILEYLEEQIRIITSQPETLMYNAFWFLLRKSDRTIIGSLAFKGIPNQYGEIEIGYGLNKVFEHNGYMTEAVKKACEWGVAQNGVSCIIAETDVDGYASQHILKRNGFKRYKFGEESWWRLEGRKTFS